MLSHLILSTSWQLLDLVVHLLVGKGHGHDRHDHHNEPENQDHHCHSTDDHGHDVDLPVDHDHPRDFPDDHESDEHCHHHHNISSQEGIESCDEVPQVCFTCSPDPVADLERLQHQADIIIARNLAAEQVHNGVDADDDADVTPADNDADSAGKSVDPKVAEEQRKLIKMGINTGLAIGLHNFPEGLATFVAALDNPKVGLVLAIAIGIHNIPEGLCVALPIYYATGNRTKAFLWAVLSGASEPFAALLGWAVLANCFSQEMYGILFGLVAGMMVIISVRELLPTAHRYDPDDTVVTYSFIGGAGIMALSLVLFTL
jgi:zinc transporter, ZIP family